MKQFILFRNTQNAHLLHGRTCLYKTLPIKKYKEGVEKNQFIALEFMLGSRL